jgi:deoxyribonuclease IV
LNDSKTPFASRRDRHELIGEGSLGSEPFRRLMTDPRFAQVIKIIETPKGNDDNKMDRKMLRRLRAYARTPARSGRLPRRRAVSIFPDSAAPAPPQ